MTRFPKSSAVAVTEFPDLLHVNLHFLTALPKNKEKELVGGLRNKILKFFLISYDAGIL